MQIQNVFEPEPSQAQILTSSPSLAEPAQLEHFGSSQLKLESARYSLVATEYDKLSLTKPVLAGDRKLRGKRKR